jgi:hypothetical protein
MNNFKQEDIMSKLLRTALPVVLLALFSLTACRNAEPVVSLHVAPTAVWNTHTPTRTPPPTRTPLPTRTPQPTNTPAPTFTPTPISGAACLVGTWQVDDLSSYLASLGVAGQVQSESGPITYQFDQSGQARVTVDHFTLKVTVPVQGLSLNLTVVIDGEAAARYTAQSHQLAFADVQLDGLTVSAGTGKRELFAGTPTEMADLFGLSLDPLFNTSTYACRGDVLTYTPPFQDASAVTLSRVQ